MANATSRVLLPVAVCVITFASVLFGSGDDKIPNYVAGKLIQLNDNGAWSWFMDPCVIVDNGKSICRIRSCHRYLSDRRSGSTPGNVELAVYDAATRKVATTVLDPHFNRRPPRQLGYEIVVASERSYGG